MGDFLDIAGSFIIGSMVVLILLVLNLNIISSSGENLNTNIAQRNLSTAIEVIEYDLFKIGYRVKGSKIEIADSNEIKFYADLNNNGEHDSIHYYLGNVFDYSSTPNPLDLPLYRAENSKTRKTEFSVVNFHLAYSDSIGNTIDYALLKSQTSRDIIKTINVKLSVESATYIDSVYQKSMWQKKITPRNLR